MSASGKIDDPCDEILALRYERQCARDCASSCVCTLIVGHRFAVDHRKVGRDAQVEVKPGDRLLASRQKVRANVCVDHTCLQNFLTRPLESRVDP